MKNSAIVFLICILLGCNINTKDTTTISVSNAKVINVPIQVGWGEIDQERNTARFEQLPKRFTGIALYYDGKEEQPFYYTDGKQIFSNQPGWTDYGEEE
jgi:hypothetical protein